MKVSSQQAKDDIKNSASDALKIIAKSAEEASHVIASAAAEALKVANMKMTDDHDLLIELKTKMDDLKSDIKELKDGTTNKIDKLEIKTDGHAISIARVQTWGSAAIVLTGILEFFITRFYK